MRRFIVTVGATLLLAASFCFAQSIVGPEYGKTEFLRLGNVGLNQVTNIVFSVDGAGVFTISTNGVPARDAGTLIYTNGVLVYRLDSQSLSSTNFNALNVTNGATIGGTVTAASFTSAATNNSLVVATVGVTNTIGLNYQIFGFTGVGVTLTNLVSGYSVSLGTIAAPDSLVLQPNDALIGTSCTAFGGRGF